MEQKLLAEQKLSKDQIEYKQFMRKMGDMAESKRNMRIDFRPRVIMRTMRLELFIATFSITMCCMLPAYFLKLKPLKQDFDRKVEA